MSSTLVFFPVSGDYQSPDDPDASSTTSTPDIDAVMGLVTFTPRLPKGFQAFFANYQITQNANCVQTVTLIGAITGGTYALEFNGIWSAAISPSATAAQLQTALQAMSSIGAGNVTVTGAAGTGYTCTFGGTLANQPLPQMTPDPTKLTTSSGSAAVSVVMLNAGSASRMGPTMINIGPRQGRIWTTGQLCSINAADSPNVDLLSNQPELGLTFPLIYDVTFTAVQYGSNLGDLAPFAFTAPVDTTAVSITDPTLARLPYQPPISESWYPGWTPSSTTPARAVVPMSDWRTRAKAG